MFPSSMYLIYSALLAAGLLLTLPYWLMQRLRHGKYRAGLSERLGRIPERLVVQPASQRYGFTPCRSAKFWRSAV